MVWPWEKVEERKVPIATVELVSLISEAIGEKFIGKIQRGKVVFSSESAKVNIAEPGFVLTERARYRKIAKSDLRRKKGVIGYGKSFADADYFNKVTKVLKEYDMYAAEDLPAPLMIVVKSGQIFFAPIIIE